MAHDITCSSCGSTLPLESQHVAVAVCPTCDNTLLIKEDQVKNIGVKATLAEPDSCLSVGWRAKCLGREITTHGRVQYKYDGGIWDEYWIRFDGDDDTSTEFWISHDEGEYMFEEAVESGFIPDYGDLRPGDKMVIDRQKYVIEEKRSAEMMGFQGYLPFFAAPGRFINYLDLNSGKEKATVTYYPDGTIKVFKGRYLTQSELEPIFPPGFDEEEPGLGSKPKRRSIQTKRSKEAKKVGCPNCGGDISLKDGTKTVMVMCSYCDSALDVSEGACKVLASYKKKKISSILPLGKVGKLAGKNFLVIGRVRYRENDDGDIYTSDEYQLRADDGEYLFLCWEDGSWSISSTQRIQPEFPNPKRLDEGDRFKALGHSYRVTDRWHMSVSYVEGELSWIAKRGDTVQYMDAKSAKNGTLTAEWSGSEMEWYRGKSISTKLVDAAFGIQSSKEKKKRSNYRSSSSSSGTSYVGLFIVIIIILFILCFCMAMSDSSSSGRTYSSGSSSYSSGSSSYSSGSSYSSRSSSSGSSWGGGFSSGK
ncbi:MAG: DUF4178 domain-containing protein [Planctomycetota bacterium]|nr:DUF4178 domain-containing protein [Planctomycetota bacterium]